MASKNRKTIIFSSKNTDLYDYLVKMQSNGDNVSEYLCNLIRSDIEMSVKKDDFEEVKEQVKKIDKIEEMLAQLMKNGVAINSVSQEEDEVKVEVVAVSDDEMELSNDEDADDLLDMLGMTDDDEFKLYGEGEWKKI